MKPTLQQILIGICIFGLFAIIAILAKIQWDYSIHNPENEPFITEVAFNLDIKPEDVTQKQFNHRYR